ncbi:LuxR C-terminal-related transcriptional regulator [Paraburkholderia sp.]|uniref:LuxR family transcriptional regulator n=1 Tax=Paraburkholderia sp. TaxID=1926495 RepID=UPI003D70056D
MRFSVLNSDAERRDGLKALLRQIDRQARFVEAQDWRQADHALQRHRFDLFVIDWQDWMRLADIRELLVAHPGQPVAILTDHASPASARALFDEGVLGVVPRATDPRLIVHAFEIVLLGAHYVPPGAFALSTPPVDTTPRQPDDMPTVPRRPRFINRLSPRQQQIMRCVHMGSTNKMIARTLGISEGTVKIHLASIFQQLGAPNRAAAVAIYNGWLAAQLEVLRNQLQQTPRPALGEAGPIPLRGVARPTFLYPWSDDDNEDPLPMAAEPIVPFGDPGACGSP